MNITPQQLAINLNVTLSPDYNNVNKINPGTLVYWQDPQKKNAGGIYLCDDCSTGKADCYGFCNNCVCRNRFKGSGCNFAYGSTIYQWNHSANCALHPEALTCCSANNVGSNSDPPYVWSSPYSYHGGITISCDKAIKMVNSGPNLHLDNPVITQATIDLTQRFSDFFTLKTFATPVNGTLTPGKTISNVTNRNRSIFTYAVSLLSDQGPRLDQIDKITTICGTNSTGQNYNGRALDCCLQAKGLTFEKCWEYWGGYQNYYHQLCDPLMKTYCQNNPKSVSCICLVDSTQTTYLNTVQPQCTNPQCINNPLAYKTTDMLNKTCTGININCDSYLRLSDEAKKNLPPDIVSQLSYAIINGVKVYCNNNTYGNPTKPGDTTTPGLQYINPATIQPCAATNPNYPNCLATPGQSLQDSGSLIIIIIVIVGIFIAIILVFLIFKFISKKKSTLYLRNNSTFENSE